ncbi:replication terminator protein [Liquorilactobacillus hordei]|uniref:replication terminator protein n=1 Tax=Liquorilactobacillus hordei TaxID=468911 RepID=UPI0039EB2519
MTKNIDLQISELAHGAIQEKLNGELNKLFENIHDPNTKATDKRVVNIKLEFKPDENRQVVTMNCDVSIKTASVEGVSTTVLTGKDLNTGKVEAHELKSGTPGQTFIDPDDGEVKTDTGEPVDVIEKEMKRNKIIDLQKGVN